MASKRAGSSVDQDPDYENVSLHRIKRMRQIEQGAKEATIKKIQAILLQQFSEAVGQKEMEIDTINQRLHQTFVFLDKLRSYVVAGYYCSVEKSSSEKGNEIPLQSIHPAVKKLFTGKRPKDSTNHDSELSQDDFPASSTSRTCFSTLSQIQDKTVQISKNYLKTNRPTSSANVENEKDASSNADFEGIRGARFKMVKRIIVGNVSKFIPPNKREGNDHATHKWMVYVRGPKEEPCIDKFVKKVWFFLHPSYRPNDIIEITKPPFHLTRRGWGEFPVRVQIHFHDPRNKRRDIIHTLKLDKTCTGLQTLGAETVVPIQLYKPETYMALDPNLPAKSLSTMKNSPVLSLSDCVDDTESKVVTSDKDASESLLPFASESVCDEIKVPLHSSVQLKSDELSEKGSSCVKIHESAHSSNKKPASSEKIISVLKSEETPFSVVKSDKVNMNLANDKLKGFELMNNANNRCSKTLTGDNCKSLLYKQQDKLSVLNTNKVLKIPIAKSELNINETCHLKSSASASLSYQASAQGLTVHSVPAVSLLRNNSLGNRIKTIKQEPATTLDHAENLKSLSIVKTTPAQANISLLSSKASVLRTSESAIGAKNSIKSSSLLIEKSNCPSEMPSAKLNLQTLVTNSSDSKAEAGRTCALSVTSSNEVKSTALSKQQNIPNKNLLTYLRYLDNKGNLYLIPYNPVGRTKLCVDSTDATSLISSVKSEISKPVVSNSQACANSGNPHSVASIVATTSSAVSQASPSPLPTYLLKVVPPKSGTTNQTQLVHLAQPSSSATLSSNSESGAHPGLSTTENAVTSILKTNDRYSVVEEVTKPPSVNDINIENCQTMNEVLKKFLKFFPLFAENPDKASHPYCASSLNAFLDWCIGKQRAAEWQRARQVRFAALEAFGRSEYWKEKKVWTTKTILLWCRRFGYTPMKKCTDDAPNSEPVGLLQSQELNSYSTCSEIWEKLKAFKIPEDKQIIEDDEIIDVENVLETPEKKDVHHLEKNNKLLLYLPTPSAAEFVKEEVATVK